MESNVCGGENLQHGDSCSLFYGAVIMSSCIHSVLG
jgi:hypothetical protein